MIDILEPVSFYGDPEMIDNLKPCPFCGNPAMIDYSGDGNKQYFDEDGHVQSTDFTYIIICRFCFARTGSYKRLTDAIAAWNRRTTNE